MKLFFIIVILLLVVLIIRFIIKSRQAGFSIKNLDDFPNETIDVLINVFGDKNFTTNKNLEELKVKLEIKSNYEDELSNIIKNTKHKTKIFSNYNSKSKKLYTNFNIFEILLKEVVDYSAQNNVTMKKAIKLLFLSLDKIIAEEVITEKINNYEQLELFYTLLPDFIKKYQKRINE